jgi:hypothetical protein
MGNNALDWPTVSVEEKQSGDTICDRISNVVASFKKLKAAIPLHLVVLSFVFISVT